MYKLKMWEILEYNKYRSCKNQLRLFLCAYSNPLKLLIYIVCINFIYHLITERINFKSIKYKVLLSLLLAIKFYFFKFTFLVSSSCRGRVSYTQTKGQRLKT